MINWKLRLKNKATLLAIVTAVIALIYQIHGMQGIVPAVSESEEQAEDAKRHSRHRFSDICPVSGLWPRKEKMRETASSPDSASYRKIMSYRSREL